MINLDSTKLLNAMVNPLDVQAQRDADKELQAVERGKQTGGFVIPPDAVASLDSQRVGVRVLSTSAGSGAGVVQTDVMGDSFIDSLLAENYALQRAKVYSGLSGTVEIPTESNLITAGWVTETGAGAEKDPTIGKITLTPKRLSTHVDVSRGRYWCLAIQTLRNLSSDCYQGQSATRLILPCSTVPALHPNRLGLQTLRAKIP